MLKFIYSEKATKFCEISTLLSSYVVPIKIKVEISQKFVAFSEYMNFINQYKKLCIWYFQRFSFPEMVQLNALDEPYIMKRCTSGKLYLEQS